jgi:hypothetical protein
VETKEIKVQRFSVTSAKGFHDVVAAFDAAIGHPDMNSFSKNVADAKTFAEVEKIVQEATGPSELMEFTRMDLGRVLQKLNGARARQSAAEAERSTRSAESPFRRRQSRHHERNGSARTRCRLVRAGDDSHR